MLIVTFLFGAGKLFVRHQERRLKQDNRRFNPVPSASWRVLKLMFIQDALSYVAQSIWKFRFSRDHSIKSKSFLFFSDNDVNWHQDHTKKTTTTTKKKTLRCVCFFVWSMQLSVHVFVGKEKKRFWYVAPVGTTKDERTLPTAAKAIIQGCFRA